MMERLITKARSGNSLHNRRLLLSKMHNHNDAVTKLLELSSKYVHRKGGYVSVLRCGIRSSDGTQMARVEILNDV